MDTWNEGYVTDTDYTYGYYAELNPGSARLPLLHAGIAVPTVATACELGFGQGISVNIQAAASGARWFGTDFNPAQAAFARSLARTAGSDARLFDQSFAEFCAREDLPDFDFVGLHGIWSWISDDNKAVIVDFLRRKLRVGGILYISYNTMPGWAAMLPMRELLLRYADGMGKGGVLERVGMTLDFAARLLAAKPTFAAANPQIATRLEAMRGQNRHYLAHEYFNRNWEPMTFARMAEWLSPAKLDFACSAHFPDLVDVLNLSDEQRALLAEIHDPVLRETVRDFMCNTQFRKDYWIKGRRALPAHEVREALERQRLMLVCPRESVTLTARGARGEARLAGDVYAPLLDMLADHAPHSLGELARRAGGIGLAKVVEAALILCGKGACLPVAREDGDGEEAARATCARLNAALEDRARSSGDISWLASPATGGGVPVGRFEQLFLLGLEDGGASPEGLAVFAWEQLAAQGQKLLRDGAALETPEDNVAELARQATDFVQTRLPLLRALGVTAGR